MKYKTYIARGSYSIHRKTGESRKTTQLQQKWNLTEWEQKQASTYPSNKPPLIIVIAPSLFTEKKEFPDGRAALQRIILLTK